MHKSNVGCLLYDDEEIFELIVYSDGKVVSLKLYQKHPGWMYTYNRIVFTGCLQITRACFTSKQEFVLKFSGVLKSSHS